MSNVVRFGFQKSHSGRLKNRWEKAKMENGRPVRRLLVQPQLGQQQGGWTHVGSYLRGILHMVCVLVDAEDENV